MAIVFQLNRAALFRWAIAWMAGGMFFLHLPVFAQLSSVTRRTVQSPGPVNYFFPSNSAGAKSTVMVVPPVVVVTPATKEEQEAKIIAFQKKNAADGLPSAQFDLGMRFLTGNGVEKNPATARKWLEAAAKQGHTQAARKLEELAASTEKKTADK